MITGDKRQPLQRTQQWECSRTRIGQATSCWTAHYPQLTRIRLRRIWKEGSADLDIWTIFSHGKHIIEYSSSCKWLKFSDYGAADHVWQQGGSRLRVYQVVNHHHHHHQHHHCHHHHHHHCHHQQPVTSYHTQFCSMSSKLPFQQRWWRTPLLLGPGSRLCENEWSEDLKTTVTAEIVKNSSHQEHYNDPWSQNKN